MAALVILLINLVVLLVVLKLSKKWPIVAVITGIIGFVFWLNRFRAVASMASLPGMIVDLPQFTLPIFMRVSCLVQGQSEGAGAHQPRSLPAGLSRGPAAGIPGCYAA